MKALTMFLVFLTGLMLPAHGQLETLVVLKSLRDQTPVVGAHVKKPDGTILTISNMLGECKLMPGSGQMVLHISHVSFADTVVSLSRKDTGRVILLTPSSQMLKPFAVFAAPVNLIPEKPWFVTSYAHTPQGLLLLAYPQRRLTNQTLFLLDHDQEVLLSAPFRETGDLMADASGTIWLKATTTTYSVTIKPDSIMVGLEQIPTVEFEAGVERIVLVMGKKYFFGHFSCDRQRLDYYCYDEENDKIDLFETVFDDLGMRLRETRDIFETNEFERRFGDMCFFRPVFAPVYEYLDRVLMINYAEGKLLFYDEKTTLTRQISLPWHQQRSLKRQVLHDEATGNFYALFESKGRMTIRQIDVSSGKLGPEIPIPGFPFMDKLSVHQGQLYFLYKEETHNQYKKIFRMSLPQTEHHILPGQPVL